jgi:hypothetical protein
MTRREWIAASAMASAASAQTTSKLEADAVKRNDDSVEQLLKLQITNTADKHAGGYRDTYGLVNGASGSAILDTCAVSFLHKQSKFYRSAELMGRMKLAAAFARKVQGATGNFYLVTTNFNSTPDTGFILLGTGSTAVLAKRAGEKELVALVQPIVKAGADAMAIGGVHTPNHRWVVSAALAQCNDAFPDPRYVKRIDQWLAEGIDIDEDGQYTERSTVVYNGITNNAFTILAAKLNRPQLLDPVRKNLDAMMYLVHPDNEVVTEISRRQDLNQRGNLGGYYLPLRYLAVKDGNGHYAAMAQTVENRAALRWFMEYPELAQPGPAPKPLPDNYEKTMPVIGVARIRRGPVSATILRDRNRFFALRRGGAVVEAVRFASAFFGKGQFVASDMKRTGSSYVLTQQLAGPYYQPFDPPRRITTDNFYETRRERRQSEVCRLTQTATITESATGFRVRVQASGTDEVPLAIEINLRPGGKIEGAEAGSAPDTYLLRGPATYRAGGDALRIGPGHLEHSYIQVRGAADKLAGPTLYVTGSTPFDHTITFDWA